MLALLQAGVPDTSLVQWFATLGVGGALAGMMFIFYRKDRLESEKRFGEVAENYRQIVQEITAAITSNTEVARSLIEAVRKNGP